MQRWSADQLREEFLRFFESKGHQRLPSASLIPHGDPTLLLTGAGMVPFKPYFLGQAKPEYPRITTCQRCLRTPDIDSVGRTDRHGTFFEMLGNFSFGDYFKREAIHWAWEFVTQHMQLSPENLWVTIYIDDDEAEAIWRDEVGVPAHRIVRLGKEDNFWEIGVGPCGPCSEIHVDRGEAYGCGRPECGPGCGCDRFLEIWNLVFIQFYKNDQGEYTPLATKGIDTGMGLDRAAAVLQGVRSIFEIDLVRPILDGIAQRAGKPYGSDPAADVSLRVITDHMRGVTFLIHDGVLPGNEGRGYVLRRLLRRAVRHARLLGISGSFLPDVVDLVVQQMSVGYPELRESHQRIKAVVRREEARFHETLDQGMDMLRELMDDLEARGEKVIPGEAAFRLYDTYGFPMELTREIAHDRGFSVDEDGFAAAMEQQRERARAARAEGGYLGDARTEGYRELASQHRTAFVGYDRLEEETRVVALRVDRESVGKAVEGQELEILLEATPFYAEGGGQVADVGTITGPGGQVKVNHVSRPVEGLIVHHGQVVSGEIAVDDRVVARVDGQRRWDTARHHTATHLLHKALHEILGSHAQQAGSLVAPDRLRFDFNHYQPVSAEELARLEQRVNEQVLQNLPVTAEITTLAEARRQGAMMLFGEKYGQEVRVVSIGDYSKELCGGTHVRASGELGLFKIVSESSVASGVRRIEAVAGRHALDYIHRREQMLQEAAGLLKVGVAELPRQIGQLQAQVRQMQKELESLQQRLAEAQLGEMLQQVQELGDLKVLVTRVSGLDMEALRSLGDRLRARLGESVVVLGSHQDGKVSLVAMATKGAVAKGLHAGKVLQEASKLVQGGGGGRPDMAQAGGKDPSGIDAALRKAEETLRMQLGALHRS